MASLTTPQFICYTEYVVASGHPGGLPDVANRPPSTLWTNQQAVNAEVAAASAEIAAARENGAAKPAASLLENLAQRLDDAINNALQSGGALQNVSGASVEVAPLSAYVDGRYQETTSATTVGGLAASTVNYVFLQKGASLAPVFGADADKATPSAVYIGEVDLGAGTSLTYAAKGRYSTSWVPISASASVSVPHRLGFTPEPHQMHLLFTDDTDPASGTTFVPNRQYDVTNAGGVWITSVGSLSVALQMGANAAHPNSVGSPVFLTSGFVRFFARRENGDA